MDLNGTVSSGHFRLFCAAQSLEKTEKENKVEKTLLFMLSKRMPLAK